MDSSPSSLAITSPDCTPPAFTNSSSVSVFTSQLDLSLNQLCGINPYTGEGTYTAKGITAIADALKVTASLTSLNLAGNTLCGVDHYGQGTYSAEGIKAIADALRVCASLTQLDVRWNEMGEEGTAVLRKAVEDRSGFEVLL